jgi:hypothetical protein
VNGMSLAGDDRTGALIDRLFEVCMDDERILAALLGGSRARGEADEFSDIDISVIVVDEAYRPAGQAARAEVHAHPVGLQRRRWTLDVCCHEAREYPSRAGRGTSRPPHLPRGVR